MPTVLQASISSVPAGAVTFLPSTASVTGLAVSAMNAKKVSRIVLVRPAVEAGEKLGFLCMVNVQRDRPQLPSEDDLARLKANPAVAAFLSKG